MTHGSVVAAAIGCQDNSDIELAYIGARPSSTIERRARYIVSGIESDKRSARAQLKMSISRRSGPVGSGRSADQSRVSLTCRAKSVAGKSHWCRVSDVVLGVEAAAAQLTAGSEDAAWTSQRRSLAYDSWVYACVRQPSTPYNEPRHVLY